jgi:hypothetical protein
MTTRQRLTLVASCTALALGGCTSGSAATRISPGLQPPVIGFRSASRSPVGRPTLAVVCQTALTAGAAPCRAQLSPPSSAPFTSPPPDAGQRSLRNPERTAGRRQLPLPSLDAPALPDDQMLLPTFWQPIVIADAFLAARLAALESRAPTLKEEMDRLRQNGFQFLLGTREQVLERLRHPHVDRQIGPAQRQLGVTIVFPRKNSHVVETGAVAINLTRIVELHLQRLELLPHAALDPALHQREFEQLVDDVLIHEFYGHLLPVALAGSIRAQCHDPRPGQEPGASCVLQRENRLRAELGLPPRLHYGFDPGAIALPRRRSVRSP